MKAMFGVTMFAVTMFAVTMFGVIVLAVNMFTLIKFALIWLVLVVALPLANATKLYKIVDENGKVTFSQYPPASKDDEKIKVEDLHLRNDNDATTRVTAVGSNDYCGDIRLPSRPKNASSSKYFVDNLLRSRKNWEDSLERLSDQMERTRLNKMQSNKKKYYGNSSYRTQQNARYQNQYEQNVQRMRDLRCAINWVEQRDEKIQEIGLQNKNERERLQTVYAGIETKLNRDCGEQPPYDPSAPGNEGARKQWYDCSKSYIRDLNKVRSRMDRL